MTFGSVEYFFGLDDRLEEDKQERERGIYALELQLIQAREYYAEAQRTSVYSAIMDGKAYVQESFAAFMGVLSPYDSAEFWEIANYDDEDDYFNHKLPTPLTLQLADFIKT